MFTGRMAFLLSNQQRQRTKVTPDTSSINQYYIVSCFLKLLPTGLVAGNREQIKYWLLSWGQSCSQERSQYLICSSLSFRFSALHGQQASPIKVKFVMK